MPNLGIVRPSKLKEVRKRLGLTQAKLAELAGVTQAYIAKIEAGEADPRISALDKISRALEKFSAASTMPTVEKLMSSPIVSVKPTETVERAIKIMETKNISQLPVINVNTNVGSVTEATLLQNISSGRDISSILKREISDFMDKPFPIVSKDDDSEVLYPLLERNAAVLVTDRGKIVGIITKADIFKLRRRSEQNLSPQKSRP